MNAVSYASLADFVLILYMIKIGADDFLVGLIASFFYLTMPIMLLGKRSVSRHGAAKTFAKGWLWRNVFAFTIVWVPLVQAKGHPAFGFLLLVCGTFGFFAFRSFGAIADMPLVGDITSQHTRGSFISKVWLHANFFYLATLIVIIALLHWRPETATFQAILVSGALFGLVAQAIVRTVPESGRPAHSAQEPIGKSIDLVLNSPQSKKLLLGWVMVMASLALVIPFSMLSLKKGYMISDYKALIFATFQICGNMIGSYVNSLFLDRVGPRPMLVLYTLCLVLICSLWVLTPMHFSWLIISTIFLGLGVCNAGINTALSHYLLSTVASDRIVGTSMIMTVTGGAVAGLAGTFIGGGLLRFIHSAGSEGLAIYKIYFLIIMFFVLFAAWIASRLHTVTDRGVKDVLGILFSLRDWRALFTLQKLAEIQSEKQEARVIDKLGEIQSQLSEDSLLNFLESPSFITRTRAIRALGEMQLSENAKRCLIEEVKNNEYTTAFLAAEILGEHGIRKGIPVLRKALTSEDLFLRGKALLALAQMKDEKSYPAIIEIFAQTDNPRLLIHGGRALVQIGDLHDLPLLLQKLLIPQLPASIRDELLNSLCEMCGAAKLFYKLYPLYKKNPALARREFERGLENLQSKRPDIAETITRIYRIHVKGNSRIMAESPAAPMPSIAGDCGNIAHWLDQYAGQIDAETKFVLLVLMSHMAMDN